MRTTPVHSSTIAAIGYNGLRLRVVLNAGKTYEFDGVPNRIHEGLMASKSKGKYFASHVRGKFPHRLIK